MQPASLTTSCTWHSGQPRLQTCHRRRLWGEVVRSPAKHMVHWNSTGLIFPIDVGADYVSWKDKFRNVFKRAYTHAPCVQGPMFGPLTIKFVQLILSCSYDRTDNINWGGKMVILGGPKCDRLLCGAKKSKNAWISYREVHFYSQSGIDGSLHKSFIIIQRHHYRWFSDVLYCVLALWALFL